MTTPSAFERDLGRTLRSRFGTDTKVVRFGDDDGINDCFVVSGVDCPIQGVTSYGSVGLSRTAQRVGTTDLKVEVLAACASRTPHIDNLVASCVFESAKNGTGIIYGAQIPGIVTQYGISRTLQHVTFVAPFLWDDLGRLEVAGQTIQCLLMLPISDAEQDFLNSNGIDALEAVLSEAQIDIYDIDRPSAIS
jgi:antitoxin YqcF